MLFQPYIYQQNIEIKQNEFKEQKSVEPIIVSENITIDNQKEYKIINNEIQQKEIETDCFKKFSHQTITCLNEVDIYLRSVIAHFNDKLSKMNEQEDSSDDDFFKKPNATNLFAIPELYLAIRNYAKSQDWSFFTIDNKEVVAPTKLKYWCVAIQRKYEDQK